MIKKVTIDQLKPGMTIVKMASDLWEHLPGLYTKPGLIRSKEQVERIREAGYEQAFIEVKIPGEEPLEKRLDTMLKRSTVDPKQKKRVPFESAIEEAQKAYDKAMTHAHRIIHDAKLGRKVDYESSVETVDQIVDSAIQNPDTLLCLSKLSHFDEYTYTHSINVSAIAVVFGEYLGLGRNELLDLGMAGMFHDLGKTVVSERIINKRGRLSHAEFEEIKRHPGYGYEILHKQGDIPIPIMEAVHDHHEKFNGSGYPGHLTRNNTSALARIISLADVYDALTSDRSYKDAMLPNKALAIMYGMRDQDFDTVEVQSFIKCLGIFPSGSLVKLNSGYYAIVYEANPAQPLQPKVKIILDPDMHPIPSKLVDLAVRHSDSTNRLEIVECADPAVYRINLKPYLTRKR
ncbi:Metal-dependent phosphohydrolase HD sub domain protein [Pseudodesulfovibrio profundus]|uniref:Metal-dependent phosphohydrolase HD sub domain protein n=1 Tax=Pseudodesulfovibrio profundus TaxID=57320 RepID=A0A2C8FAC2_9BACT|nr:HD-GYP domain-containing protein [Pseudodesulfovibrio profundus]SOB59385.1 Metal-dependent phosphohydrolase HD sub domain protein [Pseudodesulfovibrio profundus]